MGRPCRAMMLVELIAFFAAGDLAAQAVTTAALYGVVRGPTPAASRTRWSR